MAKLSAYQYYNITLTFPPIYSAVPPHISILHVPVLAPSSICNKKHQQLSQGNQKAAVCTTAVVLQGEEQDDAS